MNQARISHRTSCSERAQRSAEKSRLVTSLEGMVPKSLEVKVHQIDHPKEHEQPLVVEDGVSGTLGRAMGKRLLLPTDLFEAGSSALFPDTKRVEMGYFHYSQTTQDVMRVNVPVGIGVDAVPAQANLTLAGEEVYNLVATQDANGFMARRDHVQNENIVMPKDYD